MGKVHFEHIADLSNFYNSLRFIVLRSMNHPQSLLCTLPQLLQETAVQQFSFFADGKIHTGMRFDHKLYVLHRSFRLHKRNHVFALASALAEQGVSSVVTISSQGLFYKVWLDLRHIPHISFTALPKDGSSNLTAGNEAFNPQFAA